MTNFTIPHEERPFLDAILANPDDDEPRLVYADWLEERGDERAKWLRLECGLAAVVRSGVGDLYAATLEDSTIRLRESVKAARQSIDPGWVTLLSRCPIELCNRETCPRRWDKLDRTEFPSTRLCPVCCDYVQFVTSKQFDSTRLLSRPIDLMTEGDPQFLAPPIPDS